MRLLAKSFCGEVREWFRGFPTGSIHNFQEFKTIFLGKWKRKKNSLHLLTQYSNLRRGPNESVYDFSARFKKTYNAILANLKPPPGASKLHYVDSFSSEFTMLLRERRYVTLDDMIDDATKAEVNLTASNRNKQKHETKRVKDNEPQPSASTSNSDAKIDSLIEVLKALVKLSTADKNQMKNQHEPQVRNTNFRRQQGLPVPQVMQREPRNPNEQQKRVPFQQNLVNEEYLEEPLEHIHQFGDDPKESDSFVTKDQHDNFVTQDDESDREPMENEGKDPHTAYLNACSIFNEAQRQYDLRSRSMLVAPPGRVAHGQALGSQPAKILPRKEVMQHKPTEKYFPKATPPKDKELPKEVVPKERDLQREEIKRNSIERSTPPFNLQTEISKIKIVVPFTKIIRIPEYKGQLFHMMKSEETSDTVNLQDDKPNIMFGPWAQASLKSEDVPPFYISLTIHDMLLHNAMFDSGASHNLMPRTIMEGLGLDITRPYKDLFSFDSKKVKCLGLIKDLVVSLHQIPKKNHVMDMVVANVPPRFGMLLSRSWVAKFNGTLSMDLSYATIPVFGTLRWLYREN